MPTTAPPPQHLQHADAGRPTFGKLSMESCGGLSLRADPHVRQMALRVFPGWRRNSDQDIRITLTTRTVEDLRWFMLRYPIHIEDSARSAIDEAEARAVELVTRRESGRTERPADPAAAFTGTLMEFQRTGTGFLIENRRCILGDDVGMGKTVQMIAAASIVDAWPMVVVCQPGVLPAQIARAFDAFLSPCLGGWCHVITGTKPYDLPVHPVYIVHYDLVRHWSERLLGLDPRIVVFDECQWLRKSDSKRYAACVGLSERREYVWGLSATPIYNYGEEAWPVFNAIDYHCLGDQSSFAREWCGGHGNKLILDPKAFGSYLRREGLLLRRTKVGVGMQLPRTMRTVHVIDHDAKVHDKMMRKVVELVSMRSASTDVRERFNIGGRIEAETRRAAGVAKAPYVASFIDALVDSGERPLVYAHHHDVHEVLTQTLHRHGVVSITGLQTAQQKNAAVQRFAKGEARVCVLGLRTAAGIDGLQGAGTCSVFAELDWSPAIHKQCEGRLERIGVSAEVEHLLSYYLVCETTYDSTVRDALGLKIGQFNGLMCEDGETDDQREQSERVVSDRVDRLVRSLGGG